MQTQHQGQGPELSDVQRRDCLEGVEKFPDDLRVERAAAFGHDFRGDAVNPRQPRLRTRGDERQLAIRFARETLSQIGHLFADEVGVIEQPFRREGESVMHFR